MMRGSDSCSSSGSYAPVPIPGLNSPQVTEWHVDEHIPTTAMPLKKQC
jgi:hypothetical protein